MEHRAADLPGGLVDLHHRRQSRQAQYLRLPDHRPRHLHAQDGRLGHHPAAAQPEDRQLGDPPGQPQDRVEKKEPEFLEDRRQQGHLRLGAAHALHLPPGKVLRLHAGRAGHARPARHAGELQLLFRRRRRELRHLRRRLRIAAAAGRRPLRRQDQGARAPVPQRQPAAGDPLHPATGPRRQERRDRRRQGEDSP